MKIWLGRIEYSSAIFFIITRQDRFENGEYRWQTIGYSRNIILLLVEHTVWDNDEGREIIRIISARRVNRSERKQYEDG